MEMSESPPLLHAALMRHTGYLLSRAGASGQRHFAERLATLGLTPRTWGAMNVLDAEGPASQHTIGRLTGTDPSSMVAAIDELEKRGLVQRRPHPSDRRAHELHITDAGHETLRRGRELARQAQADLLSPLTEAEREQLHDMLRRIVEHVGSLPPWVRSERPPSG
jgi:DNA-binding MarR family transcriptional regulator